MFHAYFLSNKYHSCLGSVLLNGEKVRDQELRIESEYHELIRVMPNALPALTEVRTETFGPLLAVLMYYLITS